MIPYLAIYFIVLLASNKIQPKKWTKLDFIILLFLICFSGLRYMIGTDYELYNLMYNNLDANNLNNSRTGVGYGIIALQLKSLGINFQVFIFICALITNYLIYYFFKHNSKKPGLSLLMYLAFGFYTFSFNGFRQALSMSLFLLGYTKKQDKKYVSMFICFLFSFFIHSISGLGILVVIILEKTKRINIKLSRILPFIVVGYIFFNNILSILIKESAGYSFYYESAVDYTAGIGTYLKILQFLLIYYLFFYSHPKKHELQKGDIVQENMAKIGIFIMIFSSKNWLLNRVALQFLIFNNIYTYRFYCANIFNDKKVQYFFINIIFFITYILNVISFDGVMPYRFLFFQ